jgi:hypothetical protein
MVFSTKSKKPYTPPEWAGTPLRACFTRLQEEGSGMNPAEVGSVHGLTCILIIAYQPIHCTPEHRCIPSALRVSYPVVLKMG